MDNRDGGVSTRCFLHEKQRKRFAHNHAATEDNDVRAGDFDSVFDQQSLTTQRRAGDKACLIAKNEFGNIDWVKPVNVFCRIERTHNRGLRRCAAAAVIARGFHESPDRDSIL